MAAIEVPVVVAFSNASKICLEPEGGPSAQPILNFVLSMQIPIVDLVNALAEFQSKYDAEPSLEPPIAEPPLKQDSAGAEPPLEEYFELLHAHYPGRKKEQV